MIGTTRLILIALISTLLITGCKTRRAVEKSPLFPLSENALLELVDYNSFQYESMSSKLSVYSSTPDQKGSFKVNMRMEKDSVIWMSITPALGIEAVRVLIEPDSLMYINKIKNQYFTGGYSSIDTLLQYATKFEFLENLLVGNPVEIEPDEKYTTIVDDLFYVLQTKVKRKLKKAVDIAIKPNKKDSIYGDIVKQKKFEKATEKLSDEDLIVKRYYIRASDFRISRVNIDDLQYGRSVEISYSNFETHNGTPLPLNIDIRVTTNTDTSIIEIEHSRIKVNESQSYPFKIPGSYEPIR